VEQAAVAAVAATVAAAPATVAAAVPAAVAAAVPAAVAAVTAAVTAAATVPGRHVSAATQRHHHYDTVHYVHLLLDIGNSTGSTEDHPPMRSGAKVNHSKLNEFLQVRWMVKMEKISVKGKEIQLCGKGEPAGRL
jgi:hypothetical protein